MKIYHEKSGISMFFGFFWEKNQIFTNCQFLPAFGSFFSVPSRAGSCLYASAPPREVLALSALVPPLLENQVQAFLEFIRNNGC